jgi:hypothetical protein
MVRPAKTLILVISALACTTAAASPQEGIITFHGLSDASAAIAVKDMFIVADDETNSLRLYKTADPSAPISTLDLTRFLSIEPDHPEADIEAAAVVGNRIYWITSHGRNKDGKLRPNRNRFFATDIKADNDNIQITPAGRPCSTLLQSMFRNTDLVALGLYQSALLYNTDISKKQQEKLAPKDEGLNIEGLAASPDGKTLYIAFRNPRPINHVNHRPNALVVTLANPDAVINDHAEPVFAPPLLWDLNGLGIRSIEYSPFHKAFFLIAGPHDETSRFLIYRWSGDHKDNPVAVMPITANGFTPEALAPIDDSPRLLLLSDDGSVVVTISDPSECIPGELIKKDKCLNKYLLNTAKRTFRAMFITPPCTPQ